MAQKQYYHYDPSVPAAAIFTLLFVVTTLFHVYQSVRTKTRYFIPFIIGGVFEIFGFAARTINSRQTPDWSFPVFVVQSMGILLAPALFAASIYMELARIILLVDGEAHSIIKKKHLTKIFVGGDVLSFIFQAVGGSILAKQSASSANLGKAIVEIGLGLQILFFGFFLVSVVAFSVRLRKCPTAQSTSMPWKKHVYTVLSAGGIVLIRCIYHVIEYIQGPTEELMTNEFYLYFFDAGLMLIVIMIFHLNHPSEVNSLLKGGKFAVLLRVYSVENQYCTVRFGEMESGTGQTSAH